MPSHARAPRRPETLITEAALRAWQPAAELSALLADPLFWGWGVPRGDGHPVLVLPGLGGGDRYLRFLRGWLRRAGYTPVKSGIDRNPGWSEELVAELTGVTQMAVRAAGSPATIIGHSMGGLQGRSVAARQPELVRQVIALGSPLAMARSPLPASVPLTALWSATDRIVPPTAAQPHDRHARQIEVRGSHVGLAFNPQVYHHLARLLPEQGRHSR